MNGSYHLLIPTTIFHPHQAVKISKLSKRANNILISLTLTSEKGVTLQVSFGIGYYYDFGVLQQKLTMTVMVLQSHSFGGFVIIKLDRLQDGFSEGTLNRQIL